jgi:hypothetical protein
MQVVCHDANTARKVHFYFSDSNLPRDPHLFKLTEGLKNKPVPLEALLKFNRMKRFQPVEAIVSALKDSDMVELAEDDTAVRRKYPLPEDYFQAIPKDSDPRTIYAKGFGEETPSAQFDIEAFFTQYGATRAVRLRRDENKGFKGSVFVEFETDELAKNFLALDPKPQYNGKDLQIMSKTEYQDKKTEDLKAGRTVSNHDNRRAGHRGNHDRRGSYGKHGRDREDDRDWKTRREEDQKRGFRDDKRRGGRGGRGDRPQWVGGGRSKAPDTDERFVCASSRNDLQLTWCPGAFPPSSHPTVRRMPVARMLLHKPRLPSQQNLRQRPGTLMPPWRMAQLPQKKLLERSVHAMRKTTHRQTVSERSRRLPLARLRLQLSHRCDLLWD